MSAGFCTSFQSYPLQPCFSNMCHMGRSWAEYPHKRKKDFQDQTALKMSLPARRKAYFGDKHRRSLCGEGLLTAPVYLQGYSFCQQRAEYVLNRDSRGRNRICGIRCKKRCCSNPALSGIWQGKFPGNLLAAHFSLPALSSAGRVHLTGEKCLQYSQYD